MKPMNRVIISVRCLKWLGSIVEGWWKKLLNFCIKCYLLYSFYCSNPLTCTKSWKSFQIFNCTSSIEVTTLAPLSLILTMLPSPFKDGISHKVKYKSRLLSYYWICPKWLFFVLQCPRRWWSWRVSSYVWSWSGHNTQQGFMCWKLHPRKQQGEISSVLRGFLNDI